MHSGLQSALDRYVGSGANTQSSEAETSRTGQYSWGLEKINAPEAWQVTQGDHNIIVAVMDSGIDNNHPELSENIWTNLNEIPGNNIDDDNNGYVDDIHGWDFQDNDNFSLSGSALHHHGTFTAGLIAARVNETQIAGVAPNVRLMDLRVLDHRNRFKRKEWPQLTAALNYAIDNGARVINMSFTSNEEPPAEFRNALRRAVASNIVIVGATGNYSPEVQFPGRFEEVLTISAIDQNSEIAPFSVDGPEVDFVAPGVDVESLMPGQSYGMSSGTSWASAYVSGAIALLLSIDPSMSLAEVTQALKQSSLELGTQGRDDIFGYGLINAALLLNSDQ